MHRLLAWLGVSAVAGAILWGGTVGTFAPFQSHATATGTVTAGVLTLNGSDDDEGFTQHLLTATWELSNVLPGDDPVCADITLKNVGTRAGTSISVSVVNTGTGGSAIAQEIIATSMQWKGANILPSVIAATDGHPGPSMRDLELQGGISGLSGLNPPPPYGTNGTKAFAMCLQLHGDTPVSLSGKSWLGTFTFTLHQ